MKLSIENFEQLEKEKLTQCNIESAIKSNSDFIFEAGAGSGKTYSLKKSIEFVLSSESRRLESNNRKILCITYTNAAVNELKSRLGNTEIVEVSTIHEALWKMISNQKKALRKVHHDLIIREIESSENDFLTKDNGKNYTWFMSQNDQLKRREFIKRVLSEEFRGNFYLRRKEKKLTEFSDELKSFGYVFNKNQGKFEKTVQAIYKVSKLNLAKDRSENCSIKDVKYDSNINKDILHKGKFSHDTLLEHTFHICMKYSSMLDIIIDKYPFIFVDEFQDTSPTVIKILSMLSERAKVRKKEICIGYFGDPMQAIYSKGVGKNIGDLHHELVSIKKKQNRRSFKEIIDIYDKFRSDDLSQVSIYDDCNGGNFDYFFYEIKSGTKTSDFVSKLLPEIKSKLSISDDDKVSCLVLKNTTIAELVGFPNLYNAFSELFYYDDVSRSVINNDINKLDYFVRSLYNIISFLYKGNEYGKSLKYFIGDVTRKVSLSEGLEFVKNIRSIQIKEEISLSELIDDVLSKYSDCSKIFRDNIDALFSCCGGKLSSSVFVANSISEISDYTYKDCSEVEKILNNVLSVNVGEFIKWYLYLNKDIDSNELFLTCHNSKGLQYDNVIVFLEDRFEKKSDYISAFFDDFDNELYQSRRNLIYVSLSRAVKNLVVCYLSENKENADKLSYHFGAPKYWKDK